jgi:hypothetical protein
MFSHGGTRAVATRRTPKSSGPRAQKMQARELATAPPLPLSRSRRFRPGQSLVLVPSTGLTVRPPKSPQRAVELQPVRAPDTAADGFSLQSRR